MYGIHTSYSQSSALRISLHVGIMLVLGAVAGGAFGGLVGVANAAGGPSSQAVGGRSASCRYEIEAVVTADGDAITAATRVYFRNPGKDVLSELVFHFRQKGTGDGKDLGLPTVRYLGDGTADQPLKPSRFSRDGVSIPGHFQVALPQAIEPGQSVQLLIQSKSSIDDRWGMRNVEGCWHPRIVHRAAGGWQEGLDAFADYQVSIAGLSQSRIPVSGRITKQTQDNAGRWTLASEASNIPDFAIVFTLAEHCLSGSQDGVAIHCFYHDAKKKDSAARMLAAAEDIIRFYRSLYGYYPADVLNIIAFDGEGFGGGPFGSNVLQVNNSFERSEDRTIWGLAHEIAHEYWGWNQTADASPKLSWLCLGMGLWTDRQYMDGLKKRGSHSDYPRSYLRAALAGRNTKLLNVTAADGRNRVEGNRLAHDKGYQVVLMLEYLLGTDTVKAIAKITLERYAHQPVDAKGFQTICQEVTGQDLEWFFQEWLYTNDTLSYAIRDGKVVPGQDGPQLVVSVLSKGGLRMPVEVMVEYEDGTRDTRRLARDQLQGTFAARPWRRVILDPANQLPDLDRIDNVKVNPEVPPAFEILEVDLGDKAWGTNRLKVHVHNRTEHERKLHVHIGSGKEWGQGFGKGQVHSLAAGQTRWVEQSYWVPPVHGTGTFRVSFRDPISEQSPGNDPPFLTKVCEVTFSVPNARCNDLMWDSFPAQMQRIEPFQYRRTPHCVLYFSPNTAAARDIETLVKEHEAALAGASEFFDVPVPKDVVVFFYPDRLTKRWITNHEGDGMASGTVIAQVYNETTRLDPFHEITHIVAGQVGDPPAMLREGLSTWMEKDHGGSDRTAAQLLKDGRLVPLARMLEREEIGGHDDDGRVAYPQSASFVGFLIRTYGKEKFVKAYTILENGGQADTVRQNIARMKEIFGTSLDEMEKAWRSYLGRDER